LGTAKASIGLLNDPEIRAAVVSEACARYGYEPNAVWLRFYVGEFAGRRGGDEHAIREWAEGKVVGAGAIQVFGLADVVETVTSAASSRTYINDPVVVALTVFGRSRPTRLSAVPDKPNMAELDELGT
jgi:hypothetical protein